MFKRRAKPFLWARLLNLVWPRMGLRRFWLYVQHRLRRISASPHGIALGFATGAFASFTPFIGFHFIIAALLAFICRGSIIASLIGTVVGNPLTFPLIWLAAYNTGAVLLGGKPDTAPELRFAEVPGGLLGDGPVAFAASLWRGIEPVFLPLLVGGTLTGLACASICYWLVLSSIKRLKSR